MILKIPVIVVNYLDENGNETTIDLYDTRFYRRTKLKKYIEKITNNKEIIMKNVVFGNYEISVETKALFSRAVTNHFYQTKTDVKRTQNFNKQ